MDEPTEASLAATTLVDKWAKEYRAYLKDGGGNAHAVHPAARAALIDHVTKAFEARAVKRHDLVRKEPAAPKAEDAVLVNANTAAANNTYRVRVGPSEELPVGADEVELRSDGTPKVKRARKPKAEA